MYCLRAGLDAPPLSKNGQIAYAAVLNAALSFALPLTIERPLHFSPARKSHDCLIRLAIL